MRHLQLPLTFAAVVCTSSALAQTPPPNDARASFSRAVSLYADGNYEAALVEFQRAHALSRNPNLLYNLGAVYEALGRFVEARDALTAYRMGATPATVAQRARELEERLLRLRERIGTLRVTAPTGGLRITVDGRDVNVDRAREGVPMSAGPRRVRLEAPGHVARETVVDVTGGGEHVLAEALDVQRAPLTLRTDTEGAVVRVDGVEVARTPLAAPLMLTEGTHRLEVTRPGYVTYEHEVLMGTAGVVMDAPLEWEPSMSPSVAATLRVESNVTFPMVSVDGRSVVADGSARVPPGRHQLRVAHAGYVPSQRAVELSPGDNTARVWLDATTTLRSEHAARVRRQRTVAYAVGGAGLALVAGGVPLLVTGLGDRADAQAEVDRIDAFADMCGRDTNATGCPSDTGAFEAMSAPYQRDFTAATVRAIVGGVLVVGGVADVVIGTVLRLRADRYDRYDRPAGWDVSLGPGGASLRGTF